MKIRYKILIGIGIILYLFIGYLVFNRFFIHSKWYDETYLAPVLKSEGLKEEIGDIKKVHKKYYTKSEDYGLTAQSVECEVTTTKDKKIKIKVIFANLGVEIIGYEVNGKFIEEPNGKIEFSKNN